MSPANGARDVEASTSEVRIEFDQAMDRGGFSLCGGGPQFPRLNGKPRWVSDTVCVFPVQLHPAREYRFSVNCQSSKNFRSAAGEAAPILAVTFATTGDPSIVTNQTHINEEAARTLQRAIQEQYSYRDRVVKNWEPLFSEIWKEAKSGKPTDEFIAAAARVLREAKDPHFSFRIGQKYVATHSVNLVANGNPQVLAKTVPNFAKESDLIATGKFDDGIGYIAIASWVGNAATFKTAHEALTEFASAKGVIIDARFNAGGDERHAHEFAARFAKERAVFAKHRVRDPNGAVGWTPIMERVIEPDRAPGQRFGGKVAVLMGPRCFSSNEAFLLMMRKVGNARLFGERSHGSSGNPQPVDLGNGAVAMVPSWEAMDAEGKVFEGVGIEPDVEVKFDRASGKDAVLEAALDWLRK